MNWEAVNVHVLEYSLFSSTVLHNKGVLTTRAVGLPLAIALVHLCAPVQVASNLADIVYQLVTSKLMYYSPAAAHNTMCTTDWNAA